MYSEDGDHEVPGFPGYIKFYGSGCDYPAPAGVTSRDYQLADQFAAWAKSQNVAVYRGYPDEQDRAEQDRRFFLSPEAVQKLLGIREGLGLTEDDLNCA